MQQLKFPTFSSSKLPSGIELPSTSPTTTTINFSESETEEEYRLKNDLKSNSFPSNGLKSSALNSNYILLSETAVNNYQSYGSISPLRRCPLDCLDTCKKTSLANSNIYDNTFDFHGVVFGTVNALVGVSMFAMPWTFQQAGIMAGILSLIVIAFVSYDTGRSLLNIQAGLYETTGEIMGFKRMADYILGRGWGMAVELSTLVSCVGGCIGYLIFFGETVGQGLGMHPKSVLLLVLLPVILLSWIRSFNELTFFSIFGGISLIIASSVVLMYGSDHFSEGLDGVPMIIPSTYFNFLGPSTFLFTVNYFVLSLGEEVLTKRKELEADHENQIIHADPATAALLHNQAQAQAEALAQAQANPSFSTIFTAPIPEKDVRQSVSPLTRPIAIAFILTFSSISIVGIFGYIMYRKNEVILNPLNNEPYLGCEEGICQNIILNIPSGLIRNLIALMMSVVIISNYILILAPARENLEKFFLSSVFSSSVTSSSINKMVICNVIRSVLVIFTVFVAIYEPYFGSMVGTVGGLTDALQSFVFPPLMWLGLHYFYSGSSLFYYFDKIFKFCSSGWIRSSQNSSVLANEKDYDENLLASKKYPFTTELLSSHLSHNTPITVYYNKIIFVLGSILVSLTTYYTLTSLFFS